MMTYAQLTLDSFHRKLRVFGITLKNQKDIKKYPHVSFGVPQGQYDTDMHNEVSKAYTWLDKNLGDNWIWSTSFDTGIPDIYFINVDDALMFKLRFKTA
jgi:hypothetical protein